MHTTKQFKYLLNLENLMIESDKYLGKVDQKK